MKILVAVDGSKPSLNAVKYAAKLSANMRSHDVITLIQTVHVAETIANAANKGFDFIVMGSKGRAGIMDLLIGSVAQRVLATCKKPVLLIK